MLTVLAFMSMTPGSQLPDLPIGPTKVGEWVVIGDAFVGQPSTPGLVSGEGNGDKPQGKLVSPPFQLQRNYIGFRIAGGKYEYSTCLNLMVDGKIVRTACGRNSHDFNADSWDVKAWVGKQVQLEIVDVASGDWGHINVENLVQTDHPEAMPADAGPLYKEALRPQFHFTARQFGMDRLNPREREEGWVNDLNGLIYYEGEYHLFAQRWNKCWIHAVSKDLVHWTELEPAFWEESLESGVQSGTCVVDYDNTSGLAKDKAHPAMVTFCSRQDNRTHLIHYSLDHGRTWQFYDKNPILDHPERDPKVFWYAPKKHWVMFLYGEGRYHIFTSPNLLEWTDAHHPIPDSFECPDFFQLPVDGNAKDKRWVLIRGNGNYSVGQFDGTRFVEETPQRQCDVGPNFYATQSWANTETGDGRRIQCAWMRGAEFPGMPFNQEISFPCEMTLHKTPDGLRVFRQPIKEIESLQGPANTWKNLNPKLDETLPLLPDGDCYRLVADVSIPEGSSLTFLLRGEPVVLTHKALMDDAREHQVQSTVHHVEILLDRGSIEAFLNGGEVSYTRYVLPNEQGISLRASGDGVKVKSLTIYPLKSAWSLPPL